MAALDHAALIVDRLPSQFHGAPRVRALVAALAAGVQSVADDVDDLVALRRLPVATGAALDQWGAVLGEARGDLDDDAFRRFLTAVLLAFRSDGGADALAGVLAALFGVTVADVEHVDYPPLCVVYAVRVAPSAPGAPTPAEVAADRIARVVDRARAGGVRVDVIEASLSAFQLDVCALDVGYTLAGTIRGM